MVWGLSMASVMQPLSANHYNTKADKHKSGSGSKEEEEPRANLTSCTWMGRQQVTEDPDCEGRAASAAQLEKLPSRQRPRLQRDAEGIPCSWC